MDDIASFRIETVRSLKDRTFIVSNYQRGYKWTHTEVLDLLKDIDQFKSSEYQYCLQPLVLKKIEGNNHYELLDGQQRCTTIFIILSIIGSEELPFQIDYQTRSSSRIFLQHIGKLPKHQFNIEDEKAMEALWTDYKNTFPENDNIDNYHFYRAYQVAYNWLEDKDKSAQEEFTYKLLNHAFFIWYEIKDREKPEQVFQRFNSGKILLTGAELIKALLVLNIQKELNFEIRTLQLNEFALQWNTIEVRLENAEFWGFIYKGKKGFSTKIDLLFDLHVKKKNIGNSDDHFYAYRRYDEWLRNNEDLSVKWEEVIRIFQKLVDWFGDVQLYHLIGFLINAEFCKLSDILRESENRELSKSALKEYLKQQIRDKMHKQSSGTDKNFLYALSNLNYDTDPYRTRQVLLLFNILTYEALLPGTWFPFWRFQDEEWSLEHIHPQNPKNFENIDEIKSWLNEQKYLLEKKELLHQEVDQLLETAKSITGRISKEILDQLKSIGEQIIALLNLHGIGNLALLDKYTNSAIGNKPFLYKRSQILEEATQNNVFIPLATRNVFQKYYTADIGEIQMKFWSPVDAVSYKQAISDLLKDYLPQSTSSE
jgi:uncharacterized protein with ParB-like and HNH nuclease domain